jgi:hypothetical protein
MRRHLRIGLVLLVVALAAIMRFHQSEAKQAELSALGARGTYAYHLCSHFVGHELWKSNTTIQRHLEGKFGGSHHGTGTTNHDIRQTGTMDLVFQIESQELRHEVLATLIKIFHEMDVFSGEQTLIVADEKAVLASSEGWLEVRAKWRPVEPRPDEQSVNPPFKRSHFLQVDYDLCLHPRSAPSERQNYRERLYWVRWGT